MKRARRPVIRACLLLSIAFAGACSSRTPAPTSPDGIRATGDTAGAPSRFGLTISRHYADVVDYVDDFPSEIWVRLNGLYVDDFGWKQVKNESSMVTCQRCAREATDCAVGTFFYCEPAERTPLTAIVVANPFLSIIPGRYDDTPPTTIDDLIPAYPVGHESTYLDFVDYLLNGYAGQAHEWEVGNENDLAEFWAGTPEDYRHLVTLTAGQIHNQCPGCHVGESFASPELYEADLQMKDRWFQSIADAASSIDFLDIHYFSWYYIYEGQLDRWKQAAPAAEIISTETGISDAMSGSPGPLTDIAGGSPDEQAKDLAKYNTLLFAEGYDRIYWYLIDTDYGVGWIFLHNALVDESGARKPAFYAYQTMIQMVDHFTSVTKLAEGQYKYQFAGHGPVYVLWSESGIPVLPAEITGLIEVTNYLGVHQYMYAPQLVLGTSPVYVSGVGQIRTSVETLAQAGPR